MNLDDESEETDFRVPTEWVEKLYELSGGVEKYKGVLLALSSEQGDPLIYFKYDSGMTEVALRKSMFDYLSHLDQNNSNEDRT